jgi:hypothetical protein
MTENKMALLDLLRHDEGSSQPVKAGEPSREPCRPHPLPWRATVGGWPIERRQRWGDRANAIEDEGHSWHEAERLAFEEMTAPEASIEPPDIAAQRRAGIIPEGVEVVVVEPPPMAPEDADEPADVMAEQSDEEFLAECPVRGRLSEPCRKVFDRDALLFRSLTEPRMRFHRIAKRQLNANRRAGRTGTYHFYVSSFLASKHPRHWLLCADCKGDGQVRLIGECPNCHGLGYKAR